MKSEHRTILAIVLSAVFFILWYTVINPNKEMGKKGETTGGDAVSREVAVAEKQGEGIATKEKPKSEETAKGVAAKDVDPQQNMSVKAWSIETELAKVDFTSDGGVPTSWKIKGYHTETDPKSPLIDLAFENENVVSALALSFEDADFDFPERPKFELIAADDKHVSFRWRSSKVEVIKTISVDPKTYLAEVKAEVKNISGETLRGRPVLSWGGKNMPATGGGLLGFMKQPPLYSSTPIYYLDGKANREANIAKIGTRSEKIGSLYWAGLESRYFISALIPRQQGEGLVAEYGVSPMPDEAKGTTAVWAGAALATATIPAGGKTEAVFSAYVGPKDINQLKAVGVHLEDAIDYGWFTIIAVPILYLLQFFYKLIHNYGIAIILLTIFVKLLLHPINVKSLKSMKAMQQLQPKLKELQKKYKDDKQRLNQETMQLFKAHKANPMGGCLPMLAQFPIYIALYKVLWNSIELFHAPFFWFYRDLSAPDPYYITPILLGIFMVAQQKLMPSTSADPAQQKMMMIMPIMFSVFMLFLPVGLVVYILINTAMSVTQQWLYNKGIRLRDLARGRWQPSSV